METLSDLDQGPEVYETSDVESVDDLGVRTQESSGPEVVTDHFDAVSAHTAFEEITLEGMLELVDFSGSLAAESSGRNTYHTRKWKETKDQRLARIAQELSEIKEEDDEQKMQVEKLRNLLEASVENKGRAGYYFERLSTAFDQVEAQLSSIKHKAILESSYESGTETELESSPTNHTSQSAVLELESRLAGLEQAIGLNELSSTPNLRNHLRDLERKVNVLYNPEYELGNIKQKVLELNKELEALAKSRRMAQLALPEHDRVSHTRVNEVTSTRSSSNDFEKKVEAIYSKLDEMEKAKSQLPAVIMRLKTLHETHRGLAGAVDAVSELDDTLGTLKRDLLSWNENLDLTKLAIKEHAKGFENKQHDIEEKLQLMESRVEALIKGT
ncbi:hypothetical protein OXX80_010029 [Metschnikowia pulcherrima]